MYLVFDGRPNTRRKRKFKRMAVEYETTPSTPSTTQSSAMFPLGGGSGAGGGGGGAVGGGVALAPTSVKKRVLKHTCPENFR